MQIFLIIAAVFGLVASSVFMLLAPRKKAVQADVVQRRIRNLGGAAPANAHETAERRTTLWESIAVFFLGNTEATGAGYSELRRLLYQAGYTGEKAVSALWGVRLVLIGLLGCGAVFWGLATQMLMVRLFINVALAICGGYYGPLFYLKRKAKRRKRELQETLPDTLDLLVVCTEAGMGMDAAFIRVGTEQASVGFAIGREFQLMASEVHAGVARKDAITRLAERLDLEDFHSLASFLIQTEEFGGSVARSLRVFAVQMREKRSQKAEEAARKAVIKLLFPVVLFILPALFMVVLAPSFVGILGALG